MAVKEEERVLPLLPLRGLLVYPNMVLHLDVGRERSVKALEQAMVEDDLILLATQHEVQLEEPTPEDIYKMGTIAGCGKCSNCPTGPFGFWWKACPGPGFWSFWRLNPITKYVFARSFRRKFMI